MWVEEEGGFAKGFVRVLINVVIIKLFLCAALTTPSVVCLLRQSDITLPFFLCFSFCLFFFFAQPPTLFPNTHTLSRYNSSAYCVRASSRRPFLLFSSSSTSSTTFAKMRVLFHKERVFYYHNAAIFYNIRF